jgi:CrcB protein
MPDALTMALVLLGGGIGSVCRWRIGAAVQRRHGGPFPVGTFMVNITGCFVIGLLSTLLGIGWEQRYQDALTALLLTGVLGGYTTFSSYELDAYGLARKRDRVTLAMYWIGSIVVGLVFAWLGHILGDALGGVG